MSKFKLGDRVIYDRGAKEMLYGKMGNIIHIDNDMYGLIQVKFDDGYSYDCYESNLYLVEIK